MYIARILYPVETLGPGKRVGIWFCGCPHKCKGCSNPELWEFQEKYQTSPNTVYKMISSIAKDNQIDGFTITGGDPMHQADELQKLMILLKKFSDDFLVYTGYEIHDLDKCSLSNVSVLIDGLYIEELNNNSLLRGSANQKIHILDANKKEKYEEYLQKTTNQIQNFMTADGVISVGIHKTGFIEELDIKLDRKGFEYND